MFLENRQGGAQARENERENNNIKGERTVARRLSLPSRTIV